jgi:uncharacterized caspase-like protein
MLRGLGIAMHRPRGLASVYAPKGTIIGFTTSPGEVAEDGAGRNGTYTAALPQHIDTPDCSIETMFKRSGIPWRRKRAGNKLPGSTPRFPASSIST